MADGLNWMGNAVLKPWRIPPASEVGHTPHTERELRTLIEQSEREGILAPEERTFTEEVFTFGDRRVVEVMVPRRRVRVLRSDQSVEEAARVAGSSRGTELSELGRPLLRTSQEVLLDQLLADVRDRRQRMALLVDEFGTAVADDLLEDVLEQIVGDIRFHTANVVPGIDFTNDPLLQMRNFSYPAPS